MYYKTKDGFVVVSQMAHLAQHQTVIPYLEEAFSLLNLVNDSIFNQKNIVDLGRIIGLSGCVQANQDDKIIYAKRVGRKHFSRLIDHAGTPTSKITLILNDIEHSKYDFRLITAYIGEGYAPMEPGDKNIKNTNDYNESVAFWQKHALVLNMFQLGEHGTEASFYKRKG
jgi:hydroxymethylpyrimidine pyrophosphatase-like HAD family hydrolase